MAALLSGATTYRAFDVVEHATPQSNLKIFDGLVDLFRTKASIPDDIEFPEVKPPIAQYAFPSEILTANRLASTLAANRISALRSTVSSVVAIRNATGPVSYLVPGPAQ